MIGKLDGVLSLVMLFFGRRDGGGISSIVTGAGVFVRGGRVME